MSERSKENYEKYYDIKKVIGAGAYGCVYNGNEKNNKNELRAIKVIDLKIIKEILLSEYQIKDLKKQLQACIDGFIKEFENMKICSKNNNNSVKCYEYFNNKDNFVFIMELCDENLSQLLTNKFIEYERGFNSKEILEIMKQLNNTIKIMKDNNIIHGDLKLENILIKYNDEQHKTFTIKLADYGSSKRLDSLSKIRWNSHVGTIKYMAPEILKRQEYNYKCDLWSLGIIIYRLIFGKFPYIGEIENAVINHIDKFGKIIINKIENNKLNDLMNKLLEKEEKKRLNWDEYFNHSFFKTKNKNINLIYETKYQDIIKIFGENFIKNNKYNIELVINGIKKELDYKYKLKAGENKITIIIKNKITNLEDMFYECKTLKNIDELKYLDTTEINNFSGMFFECSLLKDIKSLENWNVSNGKNFSFMFKGCSSLLDIKPLKGWDVSNGNNFMFMFSKCSSLSDIKALKNWNDSNGNNFSNMFSNCSSLSDIKPLNNWNISNGNNFEYMFNECSSFIRYKTIRKLECFEWE